MILPQEETELFSILTERTGIVPLEAHKTGIIRFAEEELKTAGISFREYFDKLRNNEEEFAKFVNASTVNETYFFREEKQFSFLEKEVFPKLQAKCSSEPLKIWSAACSTGQEAYSLYLLARQKRLKALVTGTDINTKALECAKKGIYKKNSIKTFDGAAFKELLTPFINAGEEIILSDQIKNEVVFKGLNLLNLLKKNAESFSLPEQDIIFIRNVFIYFDADTKINLLNYLCRNKLKEYGLIFVSMNEIANIDSKRLCPELKRKVSGSVFYFQKEGI